MKPKDKSPPRDGLYKTTIDLQGIVQLQLCGEWIDVPLGTEWVRVRTKEGGRPMLALVWQQLNDDGVYVQMVALAKDITAYRLASDQPKPEVF